MRKFIKWSIIAAVCAVLIYFLLEIGFGGIDFRRTLNTNYYNHSSDGKTKVIETSHFRLRAPSDWIHIFHGYGDEMNATGSFWTKHGLISYDYGSFVNYHQIDSVSIFSRDSLKANRFLVYIGYGVENKAGIYIPSQNEMEFSLSFSQRESVFKNLNEIISGVESMEFIDFFSPRMEFNQGF